MAAGDRLSGVLCPVVTPFAADLSPDGDALAAHCRRLLARCSGVAVFGTTGEGNSLSVAEKVALLEQLVDAGIDPGRLLPGTGCAALADTIELTRRAVALGCAGVLVLPPYYYKDVGEEGLYRSFSELVERVADPRLQIYLYHIPPVAQVGIGLDLIERLLRRYPQAVAGIKDSSGDWSNTASLLERQWDDFRVFVGSEVFLLDNLRAGGAGCIAATANINAAAIDALYRHWRDDDAPRRQQRLIELRNVVEAWPAIAALKAVVAHVTGRPDWRRLRPPLVELPDADAEALLAALGACAFTMGVADDGAEPALTAPLRAPHSPGSENSRSGDR